MSKDKILAGELLQEKLIINQAEKILLGGRITEWLDGKLLGSMPNAIQPALVTYLADCMDQDINKAVDDYFTTNDPQSPGGGDGIVLQTDNATIIEWLPMITVSESPINTYGKKWRGVYTNASGSPVTIEQMHLGHNASFPGGSDNSFGTHYSSKVRSEALVIPDGGQYELAWEVYLAIQ